MSKEKSRKSKHSSSKLSSFKQAPLRQMQSQILAPIYDKVEILRRQLEDKTPSIQLINYQDIFTKTCKQHFLSLEVDRDSQIQKIRKKYQSQHHIENQTKESNQNIQSKTSINWKDNNRNKTKSLVHFLSKNKIMTIKQRDKKQNKEYIQKRQLINKKGQNEQQFQPVGEQYKKQKLYQQSLKSQTQSLSSFKQDSSLHSSNIRGAISRQSSKKYLRKGTRVRQILMRQLQTPEQRGSSASSLTYLKEYDQWVPTTLVEQKRAQLESFMNIIYGQKKVKEQNAVDLNKINLIYL